MVGYSEIQAKAYRIWLSEERKIVSARDARFVSGFNSQGEMINDLRPKEDENIFSRNVIIL